MKTQDAIPRGDLYSFTSERDLIAFFRTTLPKREVKEIIGRLKKEFHPRTGTTATEHRLQLLRKCEFALVRRVRELFPEWNSRPADGQD